MVHLHSSSWLVLKIRRLLLVLGLFAPWGAICLHDAIANGTISGLSLPPFLHSTNAFLVLGSMVTLVAYIVLLDFRCPRCRLRYSDWSGANCCCCHCGLDEDDLSEDDI